MQSSVAVCVSAVATESGFGERRQNEAAVG